MKENTLRALIILAGLLFPGYLLAQDETIVREVNVNDQEEGAQYKFSFVHLTDIHIGEGAGDYGTPGYLNDTMPAGDVGYSAERLRYAVNWINAHAKERGITFVLVTGDITDSGERSEFEKAKEILDALEIPYVPTIGNHDIWPYVRYQNEAPYAYGDSIMAEIFKDTYERAKVFFDNWNDGTRLTRVFNPESGMEHYHQNFSFEYQGFGFLAFDFNPRYHVRKEEPGIGAEARLNDFSGGTFEWLLNTLENYPNKKKKNIFLLTHQPPHRDPIALFNGLPFSQYEKMTNELVRFKDHLALWMAGHVHRNRSYAVTTVVGTVQVVMARETAANKEYDKGLFSIINVYDIPVATPVTDRTFEQAISVNPNPANSFIRVQLPVSEESYQLSIRDISGRQVLAPVTLNKDIRLTEIQTYALPAGQYLLQVISGNKVAVKSFSKIR